jgi:protein arginine kinase
MLAADRVGRWLDASGPDSDVVISTRVRLARNLDDVPFPARSRSAQQAQVVDMMRWAMQETGYLDQGRFVDDEQLTDERCQFLLERHLVSPDFIKSDLKRGLFVSRDEALSLMVNEEDHLRFQALVSGLDVPVAFGLATKLDERLEAEVGYAFTPELGFLTACPTNLGTGMRASVLVHLPGLVLTREIEKVLRGAAHIGLMVRGMYGEGSETHGNLFQISNQRTLGLSETEVLEMVTNIARQVIDYEHKARKYLVENLRSETEDKVFRSFALLRSARIVSSREAINLLATTRFGIALGIINEVNLADISKLLVLVRPENLQAVLGERLKPDERDERRATFIRECLVHY